MKQKLEAGYIRVHMIFELVGKPKEHVEKALKEYITAIKGDQEIEMVSEDFAQPIEQEGGLFSTFCECEMLVKNMEKMTWLCFNFMPASVEIIEPDTVTMQAKELTNWLNDLLSKLHEVSLIAKNMNMKNKMLVKNMNALLRNSILLAIRHGVERTEYIGKLLGVHEKQLEPFFEAMVKEGKVKKSKNGFVRNKK